MRLSLGRRVELALDRLGPRHPLAYRVVRPPWHLLLRLRGTPAYRDARRQYRYYDEVVRLAREHVPGGGSALDVGAREADLLRRMDWFGSRVALDVRYVMPRRGVRTVTADFARYETEREFDLVLCLQVLEHTQEPREFARKLLRTGRTVIVSVPYRWPAEDHDSHRHDPVDEDKLRRWTGAEPVDAVTVDDGKKRLIAVYRRDSA